MMGIGKVKTRIYQYSTLPRSFISLKAREINKHTLQEIRNLHVISDPIQDELTPMFPPLLLVGPSGNVCVCKSFISAQTNPVEICTITIILFSRVNLMIYRVKSQKYWVQTPVFN